MRKAALLLVVGALVLAASGGAGWAQGEGGAFFDASAIPDYEYEDGMVYVDGDEALDCRSFAAAFEGGYDQWGNQKQARYVLEQCERAGLPSADLPPEVRADIRRDALPETGGAPVILLFAGLLLAGAGLGALRRVGTGEGR